MGDPKRNKKNFSGPSHPWQKTRLDEENALKKEYGLKNKREVWKAATLQKNVADQAKRFIGARGPHADRLQEQLITRLRALNLLEANATPDDILSLNVKDFLERRLQTLVVRKGLAKSMRASRQLIVHGHISIGGQKVTVPSYLVKGNEEDSISFSQNSSFADIDHPERIQVKNEG